METKYQTKQQRRTGDTWEDFMTDQEHGLQLVKIDIERHKDNTYQKRNYEKNLRNYQGSD